MWPMTWFIESRPSLSRVEVESLYLYINRYVFVLLGVVYKSIRVCSLGQ